MDYNACTGYQLTVCGIEIDEVVLWKVAAWQYLCMEIHMTPKVLTLHTDMKMANNTAHKGRKAAGCGQLVLRRGGRVQVLHAEWEADGIVSQQLPAVYNSGEIVAECSARVEQAVHLYSSMHGSSIAGKVRPSAEHAKIDKKASSKPSAHISTDSPINVQ